MSLLPDSCRVAIVGAGLAGLTLARELALAGVRPTVVLEAGPGKDLRHKNALPEGASMRLWHAAASDPYFVREWTSSRPPHYDRGSGYRQRVGGRSLYWHGVCLPLEDDVLHDKVWPRSVVGALGVDPGKGLYAEVQLRLEGWLGEPLDSCRGSVEEALLNTLYAHGYESVRPVPQAARAHPQTGSWIPYSPVEHWMEPRGSLLPAVYPNCRVLEVGETRSGRAWLKISDGGQDRVLKADRVFLAAGTLPTSRLAGQAVMRQTGNDHCELVGLNDHIVQGFMAVVPRQVLKLPQKSGRALCFMPKTGYATSNLFLDVADSADPERVLLTAWTMGEQLNSKTAVRLRREPEAVPEIGVQFSEHDCMVVRIQTQQLSELAARLFDAELCDADFVMADSDFASGAPAYYPARLRAGAHRSSDIRFFPYVYPLGSVDHEAGTLGLGSLTDESGALRCLPSVHGAGPALFPRSGAANPSLTTMALATWQARETARDL